MANQETAFGLRPIGLVGNGANSTGVTQYEIASNNTNPIFQFSLCVPTAAGVIDHAGATSGGTTPALGVLMGVEYVDSGTKKVVFKNYWPGSNNVSVDTNFPVKAFVADNPNQLFKVATDATITDRATALTGVFRKRVFGYICSYWFNQYWQFQLSTERIFHSYNSNLTVANCWHYG